MKSNNPKQLKLNKQTISRLDNSALKNIYGGDSDLPITFTCETCEGRWTCPITCQNPSEA